MSPSSSRSPSSSVSASPSAPTTSYGQIFVARGEDATWTAVTGKYYDDAAEARFFQIGSKVVIMNGVDTFSYYDIDNNVVVGAVAISNPSAPTLDTNNVGGTGFNITYRITANSTTGETAASNALTVPVDTDRDNWGATDSIIIDWAAVSGAESYNVYMGTVADFEFLIARGITDLTYMDNGSAVQDYTRLYPTINNTAGVIATRGNNINGRAFMVGIADAPYEVYWGGDPDYELDFSPVHGGGHQPVNSGGKELPTNVVLHRDGRGTTAIKVYCDGTYGKRYTMTPDQVTVNNDIITFYSITEDEGESGTNAPDSIIHYNNSMWYPSPDGFKTDGTMPQIQNVLTTRRVSNTIQSDIKNINQGAMGSSVGLGFEGRLYWALPVNSDTNNEIWVLDLDRKGAWMKPWSINCNWMWLYGDNTGTTRHLILSNNIIYELTYSALTTDDGTAFLTHGQSGEVYFSEDKRMWVQLLQVVIVLSRPQGRMGWQITGRTEDASLAPLGEQTLFEAEINTSVAGWGEVNRNIDGFGRNAWSVVNLVPTNSSAATQEIIIEVDEEVQWASYGWNTSTPGVDYAISDVVFEYIETGIKDLQ